MTKTTAVLLLTAGIGFTQIPQPSPNPPAPEIPAEHLMQYYRADLVIIRLQSTPEYQEASRNVQAALDQLRRDCGPKHQPQETGTNATIRCMPLPQAPVPPK